jgi:hypothetical protein
MGVKSVKSISQSASGCDKEVWEVLNATCNIHSQITVVIKLYALIVLLCTYFT